MSTGKIAKERTEKAYKDFAPIGRIRASIPSSVTSTDSNIYAVQGGTLVVSSAAASSASILQFKKAENFYSDFEVFKKSTGQGAKQKLSLEEELLAERFRASTDVDIAGVTSIKVKNSKEPKLRHEFWLMVKRPGQTLLWREQQQQSPSTDDGNTNNNNNIQLFDLFGQILKEQMQHYKISAPMDLQVVHTRFETTNSNNDSVTSWKLSFVCSGNVYLCTFQTASSEIVPNSACITPLTTSGVSGTLEFGTPDFIMQEELGRYSGVWWSPNKKMVAYSGCDISRTPKAQCLRPDGSVEEMPFPRVGEDNATCSIFVRWFPDFGGATSSDDENPQSSSSSSAAHHHAKEQQRMLPLVALLAAYPWVEYIARLYWLSNREIGLAVLSREQERYAIIRVPVSSLIAGTTPPGQQTLEHPDMSLTPSPIFLKEHYDPKEEEEQKEQQQPKWFTFSDSNTRLEKLLTAMSIEKQKQDDISSNINKLIESFSIIRETYIPSAWIDVNDEVHIFKNNTNNRNEKLIACVAQEINEQDPKGFHQVYLSSLSSSSPTSTSSPKWKNISNQNNKNLLPRGLLGDSTQVVSDKNRNLWIIGKAFLNCGYLQTIVAIPLCLANSEKELPSLVVSLTPANEDVVSYSTVATASASTSASSTLLMYHTTQENSTERRILSRSISDLGAYLAECIEQQQQSSASSSLSLPKSSSIELASLSPPAPTLGTTEAAQEQPRSHLDIPVPKMEFFEVPIPGHENDESQDEKLQAMLMLPDEDKIVDPKSIPCFVYAYGGPHVSFVNLTRMISNSLFESMRDLGFAVLSVDSRMATRHSLKINSDGKFKFGSFEIKDILAAVDYALEKYPRIDKSRIGFHGHSYGGFLALLALGQAPDRFKVTVAGAPVTDWRLYDTGYTERYMGILPRDKQAYEDSTVWKLASNFPDEMNRCFIAHGFMDENVHITHTQKLIEALIAECKPYVLHAYPGERHGIRKTKESAKFYAVMTMRSFLEFL